MFYQLFFFLLFVSSISFSQERRAYLQIEDDDPVVSVYSEPGLNWKYCKKNEKGDCEEGIGWLDKKSKMWVVGPKVKAETTDPFTNKKVIEEYYPIQFEYEREGKNNYLNKKEKGPIGYIDAALVDFKPHKSIMKPPVTEKKHCDSKSKMSALDLEDLKCALEFKSVEEASTLVRDQIGMCSTRKEDKGKTNLYDNIILNKIMNQKPPAIRTEAGTTVSPEQLAAIDSLSRTIYGEMASCFRYGLEYPMAVARIAVNRAENQKRAKEFIRGDHHSSKLPLTKVVTSPTQFNAWLRKLNADANANPAMKMAICPPREGVPSKIDGKKPTAQELSVWKHTVRIATEAVLFPKAFKKRTDSIKDIYFYTSNMGKFYNMKMQKNRTIAGKPIEQTKCLELWKEN